MQSFEEGETKVCEYCSKRFPQQKIDLHEAYCRRNIKKCNLCFQMYDVNDQEGHEKQFHSKKQCRYCGQTFPEKQWDVHQPSCKRRPLKCTYCENDIAYEEIIKHEQSCGSRTTKCQICRKFIALRQFDVHKLSCFQRQSPVRNQQRAFSRQELRQNVRDFPMGHLQRMRSDDERRNEGHRGYQNHRQHRGYQEQGVRVDRVGVNRINVISNQKQKNGGNKKPAINFHTHIKPSHIIEPQKIRQMIDPVPISIRLAMGKINSKLPLQNRN